MANQTQNKDTLATDEVERSVWEEFDCLQRAANNLLDRRLCPKGVFRFRTHEKFEEWKRVHEAELPTMDTIRHFLNGQLNP